jgi:hypothetical protein
MSRAGRQARRERLAVRGLWDGPAPRYDSATDAERQAVEQHRQAAGDFHQARRAGRQRLTDIALSLSPEIYGPFISEIVNLPHVDTGALSARELGQADQGENAAWSGRFRRMILPYLTGDVRTRALVILEQLSPGEIEPES